MQMPYGNALSFLAGIFTLSHFAPTLGISSKVRLSLTGSLKDNPVRSIVFGYLHHTVAIIQRLGCFGVRLSSMIQAVRLALCFIGIETASTDAMNMIPTSRRMQLAALAGTGMLSVLYSDVPRGHIDSFLVRSREM